MEHQFYKLFSTKGYILFGTCFLLTTTSYGQEHKQKDNLPLNPQTPSKPLSDEELENLHLLSPYNTEPEMPLQQTVKFNYTPKSDNGFINKPYAKFIVPTILISYGVTTRFNKSLRTLDRTTDYELDEHYNKYTWVDDYLQFAPIVAVYGLDLAGVQAKHNFKDRTLIAATSYLVMGVTVETMKSTIDVTRPRDRGTSSFPSGHTATAFVGAHILMKEYKDVLPWIGIGGYISATSVGAMRVVNHKHWVSDVVTGAGIGILSAEVGYLMLPVWHSIFGIKDKSLAILPTVIPNMQAEMGYGVGMAYRF